MIQFKLQTTFNRCDCYVTSVDGTGFKPAAVNGFTREGAALATNEDYHLSDGVFLDILYEDNGKLEVFNEMCGFPKPILSGDVKSNYEDNFQPFTGKPPHDGGFYHLKLFIITKSFYLTSNIDKSKPVLYYDDSFGTQKIIYFDKGVELPLYSLTELIGFLHTVDITDIKGNVFKENYAFSICYLQKCFNQMIKEDLDSKLGYDVKLQKYKCPGGCPDGSEINKDIDFLRNALAALNYLIECDDYSDAQRIIDLMSKCGGICSKYVKPDDCGCK